MTRRELREEIFKLLFMVEFYSKDEMKEQVKSYFEDFPEKEISEKDHAYIEEKYENICAVLPKIDEKIASAAKGWKLERIGKSDLSILRLGVYEMLYDEDIPVGVAINIDYGYSVPKTSRMVQEKVKASIENMTGLIVSDVNVTIASVCMEKHD